MLHFDLQTIHAPMLAFVHEMCFEEPWDKKAFKELLSLPTTIGLMNSVGFVLASVTGEEAEILTIAVLPNCQRQGNGGRLLRYLIKKLKKLSVKKLFLEVNVKNKAALALYAKLDFKEVGRRPGYYHGTDALIMEKEI